MLDLTVISIACLAVCQLPKSPVIPSDHAKRFELGTKQFQSSVSAILKTRCVSCHGGEKTRASFSMATRESLLAGGDSGMAVIPFNAAGSKLVKMIRHLENPVMPEKSPPLPADEQKAISDWIDNGAPYDKPLVATGNNPSKSKAISAKDKEFRSFRKISKVSVPKGFTNPIDYFIESRLKEKNLIPAAEADKKTLAKRVYIDLLGVPPTPHELDMFLSDKSPDAYSKLVDKLLESPMHGERWARHWLDVARYAESHGYEQDYDRPTAYPYRDFVIKAFNTDLPYDTFLKWQIAGDEMAPENPEAWFATGFLAAGVHATQITISQVEKERYDELDDIARTIGASMLGLSIHCARCHDHKFDPITSKDYYRFISNFTKTVRSEQNIAIPTSDNAQKVKNWEAELANAKMALSRRESALEKDFPSWWKSFINKTSTKIPWMAPSTVTAKSLEGSTIEVDEEDVIRLKGKNPNHDTIEILATTPISQLKSIRLEALASPGLSKNGPGRAMNGNFALTNLEVEARPDGTQDPWKKLRLSNATATFEQKGFPVSGAIDGNATTAWAIDPEFGKDHAAIFEVQDAPTSTKGWQLRWTLKFNNNTGHGIGNIRVSMSSEVVRTLQGKPQSGFLVTAKSNPSNPLSNESYRQAVRLQRSMDPDWKTLSQRILKIESEKPATKTIKALVSSEGLPAVRLHTQGGDFLEATHFLKRGDPNQKGEVANPSFLEVLTDHADADRHWLKPPPAGSRTPHYRNALASWITDTQSGAGNLAARVAVNRLWHHHFGKGIVRSINDFGTTGDDPSHPELLEWLAGELVSSGWSLKSIHRKIMNSAAYKRSNGVSESVRNADPENRWLARRQPRRMEAEVLRDSLLFVAGILDATQFGPSISDPLHHRRAIYSTLKRSRMPSMMTLFDSPDSLQSAEERPTTTVAPQALMLLNHPLMDQVSKGLASKALSSGNDPVNALFKLALLRSPTETELSGARAFLNPSTDPAKGLRELAQVLVLSNEFTYTD